MTLMVAGMLSESFSKGANDAANQRVLWHLRQQQENTKKTNPAQQREAEAESAADFVVSIINVEQAELLQSEIDIFQEASVAAIMAYDEEIDRVEAEVAQMLSNAHVLEDGRRVFKTEDGLRVFDEHGHELDIDVVNPDQIGNDRPRWERFQETEDRLKQLRLERTEINDFQGKLDQAQERLDRGELTEQEFNKLREDIYNSAPQAVRDLAEQRGLEFGNDQPSITADTPHPDAPASDIDINLDDELASLPKPSTGIPGPQF